MKHTFNNTMKRCCGGEYSGDCGIPPGLLGFASMLLNPDAYIAIGGGAITGNQVNPLAMSLVYIDAPTLTLKVRTGLRGAGVPDVDGDPYDVVNGSWNISGMGVLNAPIAKYTDYVIELQHNGVWHEVANKKIDLSSKFARIVSGGYTTGGAGYNFPLINNNSRCIAWGTCEFAIGSAAQTLTGTLEFNSVNALYSAVSNNSSSGFASGDVAVPFKGAFTSPAISGVGLAGWASGENGVVCCDYVLDNGLGNTANVSNLLAIYFSAPYLPGVTIGVLP